MGARGICGYWFVNTMGDKRKRRVMGFCSIHDIDWDVGAFIVSGLVHVINGDTRGFWFWAPTKKGGGMGGRRWLKP